MSFTTKIWSLCMWLIFSDVFALCTPHKVKMQYVHLQSKADTSIKHTISLQSTPMLKKMYLHMFDAGDTVFSYKRELIVYSFLQGFSKGKGSSLQLTCNAHTAFYLWGWFGGGTSNWQDLQSNKLGCYITIYLFIARSQWF